MLQEKQTVLARQQADTLRILQEVQGLRNSQAQGVNSADLSGHVLPVTPPLRQSSTRPSPSKSKSGGCDPGTPPPHPPFSRLSGAVPGSEAASVPQGLGSGAFPAPRTDSFVRMPARSRAKSPSAQESLAQDTTSSSVMEFGAIARTHSDGVRLDAPIHLAVTHNAGTCPRAAGSSSVTAVAPRALQDDPGRGLATASTKKEIKATPRRLQSGNYYAASRF